MASMAPELQLTPRLTQWIVQAFARVLASYSILQGLVILFGDDNRWNFDAYEFALKLPGSPPSWGIIICIAGILGLVGSFTSRLGLVVWGMLIASVWCSFFALSLFLAAVKYEEVSFTGVMSYIVLSAMFALLGVAYKESR